ncbi:MAG: hypothetical protein KKE69_02235 [Alphaproteobacteria bacterium]|nr:hypothetical protein [Alphaproteobacteria bacterium]MBU1606828.1 hypothetical protein [Alphaproteobacteria bacterium]
MTGEPTNQRIVDWLEGQAVDLDDVDGLEVYYAKGIRSIARILQTSAPVERQEVEELTIFIRLAVMELERL